MSDTLLSSFTPEAFQELLQQVGYRAELMTDRPNAPYLRSATGGIPFEVQFVNRLLNGGDGYADITFVVVLGLQSEMPLAAVNDWNNGKRFARLRLIRNMLVLDMDVTVIGGLTPAHLQAQIGLWDQLVQELLPFLRETMVKIAGAGPTPQGKAIVEPPKDTPIAPENAAAAARATKS